MGPHGVLEVQQADARQAVPALGSQIRFSAW